MNNAFEERTIISEEEAATLRVDELRACGNKIDGIWYFAAFVDRDDRRIIVSLSHHKKYKTAMKDVMKKAIDQCVGC